MNLQRWRIGNALPQVPTKTDFGFTCGKRRWDDTAYRCLWLGGCRHGADIGHKRESCRDSGKWRTFRGGKGTEWWKRYGMVGKVWNVLWVNVIRESSSRLMQI